MSYLAVKNWERYQHYQFRNPPWVKLYTEILDDSKIRALPVPTQLLWDRLLLLAARFANVIPASPEMLAELTGISTQDIREGVPKLVKGGWIRETKTRKRASKRASKAASNLALSEQEQEQETAVVTAEQNGSKTSPALPDENTTDLNRIGEELERRLAVVPAPRGSVERLLEVIPNEHRDSNTYETLRRAIDPLSVQKTEELRDEVDAAGPDVRNRAKYAVKIAQRLAKGAA